MPLHAGHSLPNVNAGQPTPAQDAASPWRETSGQAADGARDLQDHLKAGVYTGGLEQTDKPSAYSPMRGVVIAAAPAALMWWGIASLIHALVQHR